LVEILDKSSLGMDLRYICSIYYYIDLRVCATKVYFKISYFYRQACMLITNALFFKNIL
jgi:hypothetical protein